MEELIYAVMFAAYLGIRYDSWIIGVLGFFCFCWAFYGVVLLTQKQ